MPSDLSMPFSFPIVQRTFLGLFIWLFLLMGCSHKIVLENQETIILNNHGAKPIHSLLVKPCTKSYDEFEEMGKNLKPGSTTLIRLYPGCFDADALDENGEPMATQYKLRLPPPLRWNVY